LNFMYEFAIGILTGYLGSLFFKKRRERRDVNIQVDEVWTQRVSSDPIFVPKKRKFVPGELSNFWEDEN
jgi:hypothetical protein